MSDKKNERTFYLVAIADQRLPILFLDLVELGRVARIVILPAIAGAGVVGGRIERYRDPFQ